MDEQVMYDEGLSESEKEGLREEDQAHDSASLADKELEPSIRVTKTLTRNLQLGNIERKDFELVKLKKDEALKFLNIPQEIGGWLTRKYGMQLLRGNEYDFVMSNSIDGVGRKSLHTKQVDIKRTEKTKEYKNASSIGI